MLLKWWKERKKRALIKLQEEIDRDKGMVAAALAIDNPEGKDSDKPWVSIIGDNIGEEGLQLSLDWNNAFIDYLKASGIEGVDETQIVQKWLAMIAQQQADRLSEEHLELENKTSEFE